MSVLPLPLNAIEHYMLADDSAEYPRLFRLVIRLRTNLEESRLIAAVDAATRRHPLLAALVESDGDEPRRWIERRNSKIEIAWSRAIREPGSIMEEVVEPIDLGEESALRIRVERRFDGDVLTLEFHHAAVDGLGAMQFIEDLLLYYTCAPAVVDLKLQELEESRLATRDAFGLTGWRRPIRWLYGTLGWIGSLEYLLHRPVPVGAIRYAMDERRKSGFLWRHLSESESRWIRSTSRRERVTLNDRLLRDVFLALQEWFELHAPEYASRHKRIMVPTSLRAEEDRVLPACNVVAMVNIDRKPQRWRNPLRMLRVLHWELSWVKRLRLGVIFVQILRILHELFGLKRFLSRERCQATCVVSNLGNVLSEFSDELVCGVEFYPPIRPHTNVAIGAATCGDRLNLAMHYDTATLTSEEATWLMERICTHLTEGESNLTLVHSLAKSP